MRQSPGTSTTGGGSSVLSVTTLQNQLALGSVIVTTAGGDTPASCNPATAAAPGAPFLAAGLVAMGTTLHALPQTPGSPAGTYGVTETAFANGKLSSTELNRMRSLCGFIRANGSGYGICKSCKLGGLGAVAR